MKKNFLAYFLSIIFVGFIVVVSYAVSPKDIKFPIKELGNCKDKEDCKKFCDIKENIPKCLDFAEKHNLMPKKEIEKARRLLSLKEFKGPGGCSTPEECKLYCEDINHIDECLEFAKEHNLIEKEELGHMEKIAKFIKQGGKTPGNCKSKRKCEEYCSDPRNIEECVRFAEKIGVIEKEELSKVKKILPLIKQGKTPGGCTTKKQCEQYCSKEENFEECINFAKQAGFIKKEEYEILKKTKGKGPGGCRSKKECEEFCKNPENQKVCLEFAKRHGLIEKEELRKIEQNQERLKEISKRLKQDIKNAPPEVARCLKEKVGEEVLEKIEKEEFLPPRELGEKMRECFEKMKELKKEIYDRTKEVPDMIEEAVPELEVEPEIENEQEFDKEIFKDLPCKSKKECEEFCNIEENKEICEKIKNLIEEKLKQKMMKSEKPKEMVCIQIYDPVCGENGRTYPNECFAKLENVKIKYKGKCNEDEYDKKIKEYEECGPKPLLPVKEGCKGPICIDGRWQVICEEDKCPQLAPPSPELEEKCKTQGGILIPVKNKEGCTIGFRCKLEEDNQSFLRPMNKTEAFFLKILKFFMPGR